MVRIILIIRRMTKKRDEQNIAANQLLAVNKRQRHDLSKASVMVYISLFSHVTLLKSYSKIYFWKITNYIMRLHCFFIFIHLVNVILLKILKFKVLVDVSVYWEHKVVLFCRNHYLGFFSSTFTFQCILDIQWLHWIFI